MERGLSPIKFDEGLKVANELNCAGYFETSALTQYGLKTMFDHVIRKAIVHKYRKGGKHSSGHENKRASWGLTRLFRKMLAV
jgi:hypothetical protein